MDLDFFVVKRLGENGSGAAKFQCIFTVLTVCNTMYQSNNDLRSFSMFDVGGQRDERRKWIQCFNGKH